MDSLEVAANKTSGVPESEDMAGAVNAAIKALEKQIKGPDGVKGTVTDLIRLLQLRKELEGDRPPSVSARWVDECEKLSNEE